MSQLVCCGIEPYLIRLTPELEGYGLTDFFDSDVVFLNFPPNRRHPNVELFLSRAIDSLIAVMREGCVSLVVFASSTSVYASGRVGENDAGRIPPRTPSGCALLRAEKQLQHENAFDVTILRYGGLYGYERKPGRFMLRRIVRGGNRVVNLLHRDDAVAVAVRVIEQGVRGEIFNVCADEHPTRAQFYSQAANWLHLPPPQISFSDNAPNKIVLNDRLRLRLPYEFIHPDPMQPAP